MKPEPVSRFVVFFGVFQVGVMSITFTLKPLVTGWERREGVSLRTGASGDDEKKGFFFNVRASARKGGKAHTKKYETKPKKEYAEIQ